MQPIMEARVTDCRGDCFFSHVAARVQGPRGCESRILAGGDNRGVTPCDDLWERKPDADRTIAATAGTMRRVGGLSRALMDTVRGSLVWGWGDLRGPACASSHHLISVVDPGFTVTHRRGPSRCRCRSSATTGNVQQSNAKGNRNKRFQHAMQDVAGIELLLGGMSQDLQRQRIQSPILGDCKSDIQISRRRDFEPGASLLHNGS
jgi:hypothetical protein